MRLRLALAALGLFVTACSGATSGSAADGVLDCDEGQVIRGVEIVVTGTTEESVVEQALAEWVSKDASPVPFPSLEAWSAVLDGRDVALAVPEQNGDGTWIVHDVKTCGEPSTGPAPIDGELDCANDFMWIEQAAVEPGATGEATSQKALQMALNPFQQEHGGEILELGGDLGSLVVEGREQVVARVSELENGTWDTSVIRGCDGYQR